MAWEGCADWALITPLRAMEPRRRKCFMDEIRIEERVEQAARARTRSRDEEGIWRRFRLLMSTGEAGAKS